MTIMKADKTARLAARLIISGSAMALAMGASQAWAEGTEAGTTVSNTFTLDYQVGGVDQPQIDTGPAGTDTPTEFTVDRLIDLTVQSEGDNTAIAPGAQDEELVFRVTNNGNDTQAYSLELINEAGDEFDTSGLTITYYVDDGDGIFQTDGTDGAGTAYTPGSGDATADLPPDAVIWVVVEGDMPVAGDVVDGDTSSITLVADTLEPTTGDAPGTPVTADTDGNTVTGDAENVLADDTGTANENANEGDHSATGTYIIAAPDLAAEKTVALHSEDGTTCGTFPGTVVAGYMVPGSCVEYVITVENTGATATATGIDLADILPEDLEYVATDVAGFTGGTLAEPAANTDCAGGACTVNLTGASLPAGSTGTMTIRALVK